MNLGRVVSIALAATSLLAPAAHADFISNLNDFASNLGAASVGTVSVKDLGPNQVQVTVTLNSGDFFANTGAGGGVSFGFNISDFATAVIGSDNPFDSAGAQSITANGLGNFSGSMQCDSSLSSNCKNGTQSSAPTTIQFDITDSGGINDASFVANNNGFLFFVDVAVPKTGTTDRVFNTGVVGADTKTPSVPEPSSVLLLATVALGGALSLRRRWAK